MTVSRLPQLTVPHIWQGFDGAEQFNNILVKLGGFIQHRSSSGHNYAGRRQILLTQQFQRKEISLGRVGMNIVKDRDNQT